MDFRLATKPSLGATEYERDIEAKLPRLDIEKILGNAVVEQAIDNPGRAPAASWPNKSYKSHLEHPEWDRHQPSILNKYYYIDKKFGPPLVTIEASFRRPQN